MIGCEARRDYRIESERTVPLTMPDMKNGEFIRNMNLSTEKVQRIDPSRCKEMRYILRRRDKEDHQQREDELLRNTHQRVWNIAQFSCGDDEPI